TQPFRLDDPRFVSKAEHYASTEERLKLIADMALGEHGTPEVSDLSFTDDNGDPLDLVDLISDGKTFLVTLRDGTRISIEELYAQAKEVLAQILPEDPRFIQPTP